MKTSECCLLLLCFHITGIYLKEVYEIRADDLMDTLLHNVYKGKYQINNPPIYRNTTEISSETIDDKIKRKTVTTKKISYIATTHFVPLKTYPDNMTLKQFTMRKREIDLMTVMNAPIAHIPNFRSENDEITVQTRRFHNIKNSEEQKDILREHYFDAATGARSYVEKKRAVALMAQFVYETRYQLPYAQLLRKKYKNSVRYQLGYCFALLRMLKQQQMVLYSTMKTYNINLSPVYTHLKLYEKVVKLDVDIKDLIKFILELNKKRKKNEIAKMSTRVGK